MHTPIVLLVGQAGSGKDTVAGYLVKNHGAISIAQADPMKRLGQIVFDFSDDQLWGPSDSRNAPDHRYDDKAAWDIAFARLIGHDTAVWLHDLFGGAGYQGPYTALMKWFEALQNQTERAGKQLTPRFMLQTLGTEWGRHQSKNLWTDHTIRTAFQLLSGGYRYDRAQGLIEDKTFQGPARVVISDGRFRNEVVNVLRVGGSVIRIDSPSIDTSKVEAAGVAGHASEKEQQGIPKGFFTAFFYNDKKRGLRNCEAWVGEMVRDLLDSSKVERVLFGEYPFGVAYL